MAYINAFVTHFRAVQDWGVRAQASMDLDFLDFQLEVKCRHRYFSFFPQFFTAVDGFFANTETITPTTGGFAGWLPYRPLTYELSQDKLQFKNFIAAAGLRTPRHWTVGDQGAQPDRDYILKRSSGSYGRELSGPFRAGTLPVAQSQPEGQPQGTLFAEEYITGRALKVWCWGQRPVFAHARQPKLLLANGTATVRELAADHLAKSGQTLESYSERRVLDDCLRYQGLALDDVPRHGSRPFIDYRYGRDPLVRSSLESDDDFPQLGPALQEEITQAARLVATHLRDFLKAPVLYSLDGVIDESDRIWWIEINSNPTMPPEGYQAMFSDLFAT